MSQENEGSYGRLLTAAFPPALAADVSIVEARLQTFRAAEGVHELQLASAAVAIPDRVYLVNVGPGAELTPAQQRILDCIHTRDHDGRVRRAHVERLVEAAEVSVDEWVCPFVLLLLGEYVVEIIERIAANVERLDRATWAPFLARNQRLVSEVRQRAESYFDSYYRERFDSFAAHPTARVLAHLESFSG